MIFDSHFHLLPDEVIKQASFYNDSWGGINGHLQAMDDADVSRALVSYPTTDFHVRAALTEIQAARIYNSGIKEISVNSNKRLAWLAAVPLTEPSEMVTLGEDALSEGASGFSLPTNSGGVYPDNEKFLPFFEKADALGAPVFFHPTTLTPFGFEKLRHPLITPVFQYAFDTTLCLARIIDCNLLNKLPRLKLVFASFAGVMPFLAGRYGRTYRMLLGRGIVKDMGDEPEEILKKIYVDTSGMADIKMLDLALTVFGEDRVLWGSDFPANRDVPASIDAVKALSINGTAKEKILSGNIETLLYALK
ncbi:MAG: amidohydrolase family protein [Nitrospirota bacterium]